MKKSQKPANQVLSLSLKWRESPKCDLSHAADIFRPKKLLAIPGGGLVALMHGVVESADSWIIFSVDIHGVVARSQIYKSRTFGDACWEDLCDELSAKAKDDLLEKAKSATGEERADIALELARLNMADDEKYEAIAARGAEFVATHSEAEVQEHIRQITAEYDEAELAAYRKMAVSGGSGAE